MSRDDTQWQMNDSLRYGVHPLRAIPVCAELYCLPNRLFEYFGASIPILAGDLPDQARLVERYGAGWVVPMERKRFVAMLSSLQSAGVESGRAGIESAARVTWSSDSEELLSFYGGALGKRYAARLE